jgi:predicted nucleic acid-binding protein
VAGFLLDTNVLSEFSRAQSADLRVDRWLKMTPDDLLFVSVLSFAEIRTGIEL